MKKLLYSLVIGALVVVAGVMANPSTSVNAAQKCDAIGYDGRDGKNNYTVSGNTATIKFKVTGNKSCKLPVTIMSWKAPSATGAPFNQQKLYQKKTQIFTPGQNRTLSIQIPNCFYQVDTVTGRGIYGRTGQPHLYGSRMVGYKLGGTTSCNPKPPVVKKIQVCELATKKIITIDEKAYNVKLHSKNFKDCKDVEVEQIPVCELATKKTIIIDENAYNPTLHSKNFEDCKEKEVEQIEVCVLATKERLLIDVTEFDSTKHSTDFSDCEEVSVPPKTPAEEVPEELPETGPAETMMQMLGAGSLVASAGYWIQSRRQSNS